MAGKQKSTALQPDASGLPDENPAIGPLKIQRRKQVQLILSPGTPDQAALRSVIHEWLVPILVHQFFSELGIEFTEGQKQGNSRKSNYPTPGKGARGKTRVIKAI